MAPKIHKSCWESHHAVPERKNVYRGLHWTIQVQSTVKYMCHNQIEPLCLLRFSLFIQVPEMDQSNYYIIV